MWDTVAPAPVVPSPNAHAYSSVSLSRSDDTRASRVTALPAPPVYGPPALAAGGWFAGPRGGLTVTVVDAVVTSPLPSLTSSFTEYVPAFAYACAGASPGPCVPSPKSQKKVSSSPSASD